MFDVWTSMPSWQWQIHPHSLVSQQTISLFGWLLCLLPLPSLTHIHESSSSHRHRSFFPCRIFFSHIPQILLFVWCVSTYIFAWCNMLPGSGHHSAFSKRQTKWFVTMLFFIFPICFFSSVSHFLFCLSVMFVPLAKPLFSSHWIRQKEQFFSVVDYLW